MGKLTCIMSALSDLLASHTVLDISQTDHLQRLVAEWQLLSDLSFADLLLWVPLDADATSEQRSCVPPSAARRPGRRPTCTTGWVTGCRDSVPRRCSVALAESRIFRESDPDWEGDTPIRREAIPILFRAVPIAVLGRDSIWPASAGRASSSSPTCRARPTWPSMVARGPSPDLRLTARRLPVHASATA